MRRPWPTGGPLGHGRKNLATVYCDINKEKENWFMTDEERLLLLPPF